MVDRARLDAFVASLPGAVGHADDRWPLEAYLGGCCCRGERKSVAPLVVRIGSARVGRVHQALPHLVAVSLRDDHEVLRVAREYTLELLEWQAPVEGRVVDETSIPKKRRLAVGMEWQYCGTLGPEAN